MSHPRFFLVALLRDADEALVENDEGQGGVLLPMSDSDLHHAADVLRLHAGDHVVAVEPDGTTLDVRLTAVTRHNVFGEVKGVLAGEYGPRVTLVQGLAKGAKMDLVIEKTVELGVSAVVPYQSERSVVRLDESKRGARVERWRRIALAAAKQSQRSIVPDILDVVDTAGLLKLVPGFDHVVVLWEDEESHSFADAFRQIAADSNVAIVIGPEGGLTADEVAQLREVGAVSVTLGSTILRTETAGIVGLALAVHQMGGLGGDRGE
ncbi:MAG: 16S rRNA (uracil(1498)-N(3))-methyltransferase [Actinomycetota bacterium]|jgi:16S rRNA (uracil1498-N3)-methyltransferase|nr:16S rRNA (uracil(1498)-N(3))-methyltransferase [Actinomycetota bacterium]